MKNVNKIVKKWHRKLGLHDWKISFELVDQFKRKDKYPQTGDIKVDTKSKQAIVLILKNEKDIEKIIVHELIHLLIWDWDHSIEQLLKNKSVQEKHLELLEQTVSQLTKILLKNT